MDIYTLLNIPAGEATRLPAWGWATGTAPVSQAALDQAIARYMARWGSSPPPALIILVSETNGLVPGANCNRPAVVLTAKVGTGNVCIYPPPPPPSTSAQPAQKK